MSVAMHSRMIGLEKRLESLEAALQILLNARPPEMPQSERLAKIESDIHGLKVRVGRFMKEVA